MREKVFTKREKSAKNMKNKKRKLPSRCIISDIAKSCSYMRAAVSQKTADKHTHKHWSLL